LSPEYEPTIDPPIIRATTPVTDLAAFSELSQWWWNRRDLPETELATLVTRELNAGKEITHYPLGRCSPKDIERIYEVYDHYRRYIHGRKALVYHCKSTDTKGNKIKVEVEARLMKPRKYPAAVKARAAYRKKLSYKI
jgi:hypothetical protein